MTADLFGVDRKPTKSTTRPRRDPAMARGEPNRDGPDFWPTPPCLIQASVEHVLRELPPGTIWECAAGKGGLAQTIAATGRKVIATDLYPQDAVEQHDFRSDQLPPGAVGSIALTNPPNRLWDSFLSRGLTFLDRGLLDGIVLLARNDYLRATERVAWFNRMTQEIHCNWRVRWKPKQPGDPQPRHAFHWLIWHRGARRPPLYLTLADITKSCGCPGACDARGLL